MKSSECIRSANALRARLTTLLCALVSFFGAASQVPSSPSQMLHNAIDSCVKAHFSQSNPASAFAAADWSAPSIQTLQDFVKVRSEARTIPTLASKGAVGFDPANIRTAELVAKLRSLYAVSAKDIAATFEENAGSNIFVSNASNKVLAEVVKLGDSEWRCTFYGAKAEQGLEVMASFANGTYATPRSIDEFPEYTSGLNVHLLASNAGSDSIGMQFSIVNPLWIERSGEQPFHGQFYIGTQRSPDSLTVEKK